MRKIGKGFIVLAMLTAAPIAALFGQGAVEESNQPLLVRAAGETPVAGKCIFKEDLDLIAARRALKRTTLNNDAEAPFDPDYLVGRWKFEYDVSESALGPEGQVSGTETIQHMEGCLYEGNLQAKGPAGAFTVKSMMIYDPNAHHWQAAPRTVKGKKVRLKGTTFMSSPGNYRPRTEISEGDDPFVNLGTVWFQRQAAPGGK